MVVGMFEHLREERAERRAEIPRQRRTARYTGRFMTLQDRVNEVVDAEMFDAFWKAVEHLGTTDLVRYLDAEAEVDPLRLFIRERLLARPDCPEQFLTKLSRPAVERTVRLKGPHRRRFGS